MKNTKHKFTRLNNTMLALTACLLMLATTAQAQLTYTYDQTLPSPSWWNAAWGMKAHLGDVDGDGDLDVMMGYLYINDGAGNFTQRPRPGGLDFGEGRFADLDGDGDLDWINGTRSGYTPSLHPRGTYQNDGAGNFTLWHADEWLQVLLNGSNWGYQNSDIGDVDGDGDDDFVYRYGNSTYGVALSNGDGTFTLGSPVQVGGWNGECSLGDIDGDGDPDLVTAVGSNTLIIVYENDGTGSFTEQYRSTPISSVRVRWPKIGDLNGDGHTDMASGADLWLGDGAFGFTHLPSTAATGAHTSLVDLDFDGDLDYAHQTIWFNDGTGALSGYLHIFTGRGGDALDFGDVGGDGDIDCFDSRGHIWLASGVTPPPTNLPPDCSGATIADQSAGASCGATISGADVTGVTDPDGDDEGNFAVQCLSTDNCDASPSIVSVMQSPAMNNPTMKFKTKSKNKLVFDLKKNEVKVEGPDPQALWAQVQADGGVAVSNGQVLKLKAEGGHKHEFKFDKNGVLMKVKAPQAPTMLCTATDAAGNVGTATATPALTASDDDDDDDDDEVGKRAGGSVATTSSLPDGFALEQNYPNPFNPTTNIRFAIPEASPVTLQIFNSAGQLVRTLVAREMPAGYHTVTWDALDDNGKHVATGLYMYKLKAGAITMQRKLVLMK